MPRTPLPIAPVLRTVHTPLWIDQWRLALATHPDRSFVDYVLEGMQAGFRISINYAMHSCAPARGNMLSTLDHPEVVADYLENELKEGRVTEFTDMSGMMGIQLSPFGVIPQKSSGRWRLILISPAHMAGV